MNSSCLSTWLASTLLVLLLSLSHWFIDSTDAAQGFLMSPPPRSYTTLTARTSLTNSHPCGGNAFATQYPSISKIYSGFVHQHVLDPDTQYITEGGLLNVTWLPIFFSTNTSQYRFSLCMDTSEYTYTKCVILSEYLTNITLFSLYLSEYDINAYNSGYNYHWSSITERFNIVDKHLKQHSLVVPDHIFHSLGIIDTHTNEGNNISATLIFEWIINDFETIDNCADIIILPQSDDNEDHSINVNFDDLVSPTIKTLPDSVCTNNPNGTKYSKLDYASVGDHCGPEQATCAPGQCCNSDGVCGPYISNIYEYYYNDILLETIPVLTALPNFGFIDLLSASMSFCETNVLIDNRYIPDSTKLTKAGYDPNDFIDLCWKCNLNDPSDCSYDNWFETNNTVAITNQYKFYDSATHSGSDNTNTNTNGGHSGGSSNNDNGDNSSDNGSISNLEIIVVVVLLIIFCCIFTWLYRTYKSDTKRNPKMRLLDIQSDDLGHINSMSHSAIDATGATMHTHDDVTFGQHGYDQISPAAAAAARQQKQQQRQGDHLEHGDGGSDVDEHETDPLDDRNVVAGSGNGNGSNSSILGVIPAPAGLSSGDSQEDNFGGILGRASLDSMPMNEKPLPAGWEEYRTDAGEKYYHHRDRNITQWDRPQ